MMDKENLQLRRLGENDHVTSFDCGDEDLNDFILTVEDRGLFDWSCHDKYVFNVITDATTATEWKQFRSLFGCKGTKSL